mmetsp:Transcript_75580/g.216413  ORF Transcript_75580/g.216413 Transcript_75580/m.216413 type:complete len:223 (-) Transcript_75580:884-1552(-)
MSTWARTLCGRVRTGKPQTHKPSISARGGHAAFVPSHLGRPKCGLQLLPASSCSSSGAPAARAPGCGRGSAWRRRLQHGGAARGQQGAAAPETARGASCTGSCAQSAGLAPRGCHSGPAGQGVGLGAHDVARVERGVQCRPLARRAVDGVGDDPDAPRGPGTWDVRGLQAELRRPVVPHLGPALGAHDGADVLILHGRRRISVSQPLLAISCMQRCTWRLAG